jgi:hypothetical protein
MVGASPIESEHSAPSMALYSLPFALVYIGGAIALGFVATRFGSVRPGSLSYLGHLLAAGGALLSGWLFTRRHQRPFTPDENGRLVAYCICWMFLLEGGAFATHPEFLSLPFPLLLGALAFGICVDVVIVWGSFRYVVRKALARSIPQVSAHGPPLSHSGSWSSRIKPYMAAPLLVLVAIVAGIAFLKSTLLPQVTVADIPRVLGKVSAATRTPAFATFVFTTPDRPNPKDAVNVQFSLENGRPGLDWVLLGTRNLEDKASFVGYIKRRGYSFSERAANGVSYLRIEDGDLAALCREVITGLYARPRSEPMGLIVSGFEWDSERSAAPSNNRWRGP